MNFSLSKILQIADDIHGKVFDEENSITVSDYINSVHQLRAYIEQIKSVTQRIETIHRTCLNKIQKHVDVDENDLNEMGPAFFGGRGGSPDSTFSLRGQGRSPACTQMEIVPNIKTDVKIVRDLDMIPNVNLYWVDGQFAIRINNVIIKGNVGNIYNKEGMNKIVKVKNVNKCTFGSECKKIMENKECLFYHEPTDAAENSKCEHEQFIRNYVNSSWMYSPNSFNKKNMCMRRVGDRDFLNYDIEKLLKYDKKLMENEIDIRINQTMHDILVLMSMKGTTTRY